MKRVALTKAAICVFVCAESFASEWLPFIELHSNTYSEPVPIFELIEDEFDSDLREGSEFAFTHDIARFGVRRGPWEASVFYRYDYYLKFHPDTAELYYRDRTDQPVEANRDYQIHLQAVHAQMYGFSLARAFRPHPKVRLAVRLNLLRTYDLTDGVLEGHAIVAEDESYSGSAWVDYSYQKDYLFDRPSVEGSKGWGASADLYLKWEVGERVGLELFAEDIVSRVEWKDAPFTTAEVNSRTTTFDENGFIDVQPVLSGFEGYDDFSQELPRRYQLRLAYRPVERLEAELQFDRVQDFDLYRVNLAYQQNQDFDLQFSLDFTRRALGLGFRHRAIEFFLLSDDLNFKDARALEFRFGLRFNI